MKTVLYSGPKLLIKDDGIRIRKRKVFIPYQDIKSIKIKNAHVTRGWLGLIFIGIILNIFILFLLYYFLMNFYDMVDAHGNHLHYSHRSPGMIVGFLVILPVIISFRLVRYFNRPLMVIIKWDKQEFRIRFSELNLSVSELRSFLEGKAVVEDGG